MVLGIAHLDVLWINFQMLVCLPRVHLLPSLCLWRRTVLDHLLTQVLRVAEGLVNFELIRILPTYQLERTTKAVL